MVLNVVEPHSSGIGGGLFLLYHDKKSKKNIYFNGRETAPINSFAEMFLDNDGNPQKFLDVVGTGLAVGTPGALHALKNAHQKYGKIKWQKLFEPAIKIAREGYTLNEKMYVNLNSFFSSFSKLSTCACTDTSRAETDSSQIINFGCKASARAIHIRWRCPPENS